jgi:hypothetical protein
MSLTGHALDATTLVPRAWGCGHNQNPAGRKIIDVDVYAAGQKRGTWRKNADMIGTICI